LLQNLLKPLAVLTKIEDGIAMLVVAEVYLINKNPLVRETNQK